MIDSPLSWEGCELDNPSVRISQNHTLRRIIERIEGEGNKKIIVRMSWKQALLGNTLQDRYGDRRKHTILHRRE